MAANHYTSERYLAFKLQAVQEGGPIIIIISHLGFNFDRSPVFEAVLKHCRPISSIDGP
jgi:hypothetical protein